MTVAEALERCPQLGRVLSEMGLACCACFGAETDTLEQVARVYGLDPDLLLRTLNVAELLARSKASHASSFAPFNEREGEESEGEKG